MKTFGRDLLDRIKKQPIDGELAHCIYSPPYRPLFTYDEILLKGPKFAAVNILLYMKGNDWYFPLMVRSINQHDRHSGQISLPGGKQEPEDSEFSQTAIRETYEEMGINPHYIRIIREISPVYIPPSNFYVHSFISYTKKNPEFKLQKSEAVELIEFPVADVINLSTTPEMKILPTSRGTEVPVIEYDGHIIWGATSMIISEFSQLLKNL